VKNNLDVYYFMINSIVEFPEIKEPELCQLVYDEFGYERFAKNTFKVRVLANLAKCRFL